MPPTDDVPADQNETIRTILAAVIRLEGSVEKLATGQQQLVTGQEKLAVRIEQVVGMIELVDARIDRLAESFIRHEHPHDHAEAA